MKKLLLGSIVLLMFSASIILFNISCNKESDAQSNSSSSVLIKKILFYKDPSPDLPPELWVANYDGGGQQKINISLPTGLRIGGNAKLSPDGMKIFFDVFDTGGKSYIYSSNIDGTAPKLLIDGSNTSGTGIQGVY
jgi:Tol biopolymer transport system component